MKKSNGRYSRKRGTCCQFERATTWQHLSNIQQLISRDRRYLSTSLKCALQAKGKNRGFLLKAGCMQEVCERRLVTSCEAILKFADVLSSKSTTCPISFKPRTNCVLLELPEIRDDCRRTVCFADTSRALRGILPNVSIFCVWQK